MNRVSPIGRRTQRAQATVEFTLAFMIFALLLFGGIDTARAIFEINGLNRAAEVIAHGLADQFDASPTSTNITSQLATSFLQQAQRAGDVPISSAEPTTVVNGNAYQQLSNSSVYICGSPNLDESSSTNPASGLMVLKVTVKASFRPVISIFIGGRTITLSKSVTVLTQGAEAAGGSYQDFCPSP
jgi:Flp pilus assembly protein TadG